MIAPEIELDGIKNLLFHPDYKKKKAFFMSLQSETQSYLLKSVKECSKNNFPIFKNRTGQTSLTGLTCPTCLTLPNGEIIFRAFLTNLKQI